AMEVLLKTVHPLGRPTSRFLLQASLRKSTSCFNFHSIPSPYLGLVVHHARKDANATRPGQALRGSGELHGWGDSNLYMRRRGAQLTLSTDHRAAASQDHIPLQLTQTGSGLALCVASDSSIPEPGSEPSALQRVQQILTGLDQPVTVQQLRKLCGLRTATVCSCLAQLAETGVVTRDSKGYQLI